MTLPVGAAAPGPGEGIVRLRMKLLESREISLLVTSG